MTDYQALLAAVLQSPDDDAPRLILADLLDEMGKGDRAEFIRVQVELAPWNVKSDPVNNGRYVDLRQQEKKLLSGDWRLLAPDMPMLMVREKPPRLMNHVWTGFHRGFVEELAFSGEDCVAKLDEILFSHPIRKVQLSTWPGQWNHDRTECRVITNSRRAAISRHSLMSEGVRLCLEALWHGIRFELPPVVHATQYLCDRCHQLTPLVTIGNDRPGRTINEQFLCNTCLAEALREAETTYNT